MNIKSEINAEFLFITLQILRMKYKFHKITLENLTYPLKGTIITYQEIPEATIITY